MIGNLPAYIRFIFIATVIITALIFLKAKKNSGTFLLGTLLWLALHSVLALRGFYTETDTVPPRFALLGIPPVLIIVLMFATKRGRDFIDSLNLKTLTWLHTIRIPVEFVLLWLSYQKSVPQLMTFEGRNFDIVAGSTAPFVAYLVFYRKLFGKKFLLVWNIICLGLLLNIIINAVLSVPSPFQQFAFEQPNIAILYFPFVWLPCYVVPIVLFSHLTAIRQVLRKKEA